MNTSDAATTFRNVMGSFATGVAIVTARHGGRNCGMTVNSLVSVSLVSVSLDPCLLLVCLAYGRSTTDAVLGSGQFAVHLLREDQGNLCRRFVTHDSDKFDNLALREDDDMPVLAKCLAYAVCAVERVHAGGDHDIIVGRVRDCGQVAAPPLLYLRGQFGRFAELGVRS